MNREMKKTLAEILIFLSLGPYWFAGAGHMHVGSDSPIARYLSKPIAQFTEEQYQEYLIERRKFMANENPKFIPLAKLLTFPWNVNYDDYKTE